MLKLAKINFRFLHLRSDKGIQNSINRDSLSNKRTKGTKLPRSGKSSNPNRNFRNAERRCPRNRPGYKGPIYWPDFLKAKERRKQDSTNPEFKATEQTCSIYALQDGIHQRSEGASPKRLLDGQDRPEECLLAPTHLGGAQEITEIQMERDIIPNEDPPIWISTGTSHIHQSDENPSGTPETTRSDVGDLPRRHAVSGKITGGDKKSKRLYNLSSKPARTDNKLQKVYPSPIQGDGISWVCVQHNQDANQSVGREKHDADFTLPADTTLTITECQGTVIIDWETASSKPCNYSDSSVIEEPSEIIHTNKQLTSSHWMLVSAMLGKEGLFLNQQCLRSLQMNPCAQ